MPSPRPSHWKRCGLALGVRASTLPNEHEQCAPKLAGRDHHARTVFALQRKPSFFREWIDPFEVAEFSELVAGQNDIVCEGAQAGVSSLTYDHGIYAENDAAARVQPDVSRGAWATLAPNHVPGSGAALPARHDASRRDRRRGEACRARLRTRPRRRGHRRPRRGGTSTNGWARRGADARRRPHGWARRRARRSPTSTTSLWPPSSTSNSSRATSPGRASRAYDLIDGVVLGDNWLDERDQAASAHFHAELVRLAAGIDPADPGRSGTQRASTSSRSATCSAHSTRPPGAYRLAQLQSLATGCGSIERLSLLAELRAAAAARWRTDARRRGLGEPPPGRRQQQPRRGTRRQPRRPPPPGGAGPADRRGLAMHGRARGRRRLSAEAIVCAVPVGPLREIDLRGLSDERLRSLHRQRQLLASKRCSRSTGHSGGRSAGTVSPFPSAASAASGHKAPTRSARSSAPVSRRISKQFRRRAAPSSWSPGSGASWGP